MNNLTEKQKTILEFVSDFSAKHGFKPTFREIAGHFDVHVGAVQKHIKALVKKGHLTHTPKISRGLSVAQNSEPSFFKDIIAVPVLGRVAAGIPLEAVEDIEEYVHIDKVVVKGGKPFALKVKGDSMINAGINEGDIVVVRKQETAEHNDVVVAMIDNEATVKKLYRKNHETYLVPANPAYKPIRADNITILGKVVFLMRNI
ncbi:MAG: transcriptional repressor LexA [Elusimicrobia bacterium]|nr:transcriptional repressor LexA [Candidatus Liberimonas magnetica]